MKILNKIMPIYSTKNTGLCGMTDEFFCAYIYHLFLENQKDFIIIVPSLYEANKIYDTLQNYTSHVLLFPMDEFLTSESIAISPELKTIRLDTIHKLLINYPHIVVTHLESYLRFLPSKSQYLKSVISIQKGDNYSRNKLMEKLFQIGYRKESIVTNTGEVSVRGFIIDVYPIDFVKPIRIEFFDDEIESIRTFDAETQKSISSIEKVEIYPNTEFLTEQIIQEEMSQKYLQHYNSDLVNIEAYLKEPIKVVKNFSQFKVAYAKLAEEMLEYRQLKDSDFSADYMFPLEKFDLSSCLYYNSVDNLFPNLQKNQIYDFGVKSIPEFSENISAINDFISHKIDSGYTIIICILEHQVKSVSSYLTHKYILTNEEKIYDQKVNIVVKKMQEGFLYGKYVFLTPKELFRSKTVSRFKTTFKYTTKVKSLSNLVVGDYVVHAVNGIGVYNGLKTIEKNHLKKDYLEILYAGSDKIYIPVEKIELIGKYTGKEGMAPKINRLGSTEWQKTKQRVRNRVRDIAKQLLELYAKRALQGGISFRKDDELQMMFEEEFEYQETPDQLKAIDQIKQDMESSQPMDRLLCGDVGYGKTEVAFRAMFKAVNNSKQVLYLCPTTILSRQQYDNAKIRFANFPVSIALLNRFTSPSDVKKIVEDINLGKVDIVFGTHRLLSTDIKPKKLGLLVVDEEQRFGVSHKEKIKKYKENIDVLTLTATPIPRTLQMSLMGIRSLSLIETPPIDRYPIQTYVIEENAALIKDAIYKEMSRKGQVFVLYNNVQKIQSKVNELQRLVPEAKIIYAHGQLNKTELEDRMLAFINYEYDVMVCTTIIETGIDITNVNTLIIYNADYFGLSQLYQIRGRVGRGNRLAYAYLMYQNNKLLNEIAVKRLQAIKEFTELGSGFAIASRDLSIRGAGDILGSEQAGFIDSIGIDLYLKILNEEINRLKGIEIEEEELIPSKNLLEVDTHISDQYVEDADVKIEIHRLINKITNLEELNKTKEELEDRFGRLDEKLLIYLHEEWFEAMAKRLRVMRVIQNSKYIEISFNKESSQKINGEELFVQALKIHRNFNFKYQNGILKVILNLSHLEKHYIFYLTALFSKLAVDDYVL